jgi:hypothetical protein
MKRSEFILIPVLLLFSLVILSACGSDTSVVSVDPFQQQAQVTVNINSLDTFDIYKVTVIARQLDTVDSVLYAVDTVMYYEPANGSTLKVNIPADNPAEVTVDLFRNNALVSTGTFSTTSGYADTVINLDVEEASVPPAPTNVSAMNNGTSVTLSWDAASGADIYYVYRTTDTTSGHELLKRSWLVSTTDGTVSPGNIYYYRVSSASLAGESLPSDWIAVEISEKKH